MERIERNIAEKARVGGLVDTFYRTLDPKKRITLPSEWRDALGFSSAPDAANYVYVFPDAQEDCLDLLPVSEMERFLSGLQSEDVFDPDSAAIEEAIAEHAQMLKVDSSGRIRVGDELLAFAGISSTVTMKGAFRRAKIWAGEKKPKPEGKLDVSAFRAALAYRRSRVEASGDNGGRAS